MKTEKIILIAAGILAVGGIAYWEWSNSQPAAAKPAAAVAASPAAPAPAAAQPVATQVITSAGSVLTNAGVL